MKRKRLIIWTKELLVIKKKKIKITKKQATELEITAAHIITMANTQIK